MQHSILIVDDEPGIRDSLRSVLADEGFAVESGDGRRVSREGRSACIRLHLA